MEKAMKKYTVFLILTACILLVSCAKKPFCGVWDRGGQIYRISPDGNIYFEEISMPYLYENEQITIYRDGKNSRPLVYPCNIGEDGILYINGLPYYPVQEAY